MSEMVDRIAIVLAAYASHALEKTLSNREAAALVIKAMREPTAAMIEAGLMAAIESRVDAEDIGDSTAVYQAMIDAAVRA